MEIRPFDSAVGAEVAGVDLGGPFDDATFAAIRGAWLEHGIVLVRGQKLGPEALAAFSARFGPLEMPPASAIGDRAAFAGSPVWLISNVIENGEPIGSLGAGEAEWHSDMSYLPRPPTASVLFAREVPPVGGNTSFAGMHAAYDALDAARREAWSALSLVHDGTYTSAGERRRGSGASAIHPLVRVHPETGRPALYPGRRTGAAVSGWDEARSEAFLDDLWAHCSDRAFVHEHVWREGDLLVWDNRQVLHRRDAFDPDTRRIMLRCQVAG